MGGKAFKNLDVCRLDKDDYRVLSEDVLERLSYAFRIRFQEIPSYRNKVSFGDMDVLYSGPIDLGLARIVLKAKEMIRNGDVTSYAVPVGDKFFQVDLIKVPNDVFDFSYGYFSYNDLGNLLGRIYHRMGFKFGHLGLRYIIRDEENSSHVLKEIMITNNFKTALEFVGYDYKRWQKGFDSLEDVFRYAVSIPLANRVIFRLDETNHAARVRDRKRETYKQFLVWVNDPANEVPEKEIVDKSKLRDYFLKKSFMLFPQFRDEYKEAQFLYRKIRLSKEKFNGLIVSNLTGLQGKELGQFIRNFTQYVMGKYNMSVTDWALSFPIVDSEILYFFRSQLR